ncbi:HAD family hydrolase [Ramlibacter rhizophilus]|uniref:HAD family hydrolase n=1 Tax=Ramlibacter rhizophilus TaxID=1781167 RepID=A0A4Z0BFC0_9BURK|nr:HAD-IA family hydrolase [Ramlibacter rhizophilus]TFY96824.1 HAD family hydrolase [Ramlibacter rhizophilus]
MLDLTRIRALSIDLDDTLWPIWPCIERAEKVLHEWLVINAPATATLFASAEALREIRRHMNEHRPDLKHDLSALRRESIRLALERAGDDALLAEHAFEVFFAERQKVTPFEDAHPALEFLSARFPLVSLSNGNADLARVGMARYFRAAVSARSFGIPKPDARIFHAAADAAGVRPEEVLHVGDDVLLDVLGAQGAGMQAAWINRGETLWPHDDRVPEAECFSLSELCGLLRA